MLGNSLSFENVWQRGFNWALWQEHGKIIFFAIAAAAVALGNAMVDLSSPLSRSLSLSLSLSLALALALSLSLSLSLSLALSLSHLHVHVQYS